MSMPDRTRAGKMPADTPRTPEELRDDLGELRNELGDTVEELTHRADVPARVKAKRDETLERVQQQAAHVQNVIVEKAPQVQEQVQTTAREQPWLVGSVAAVVALLLFGRLRARNRRRKDGRTADGTR